MKICKLFDYSVPLVAGATILSLGAILVAAIGTLRSASSGVVQVLPQGGIEISDYGSYDTQSMNKEVMVTVRATFEL